MLDKFEKWVINTKSKINPKVLGVSVFCIFGLLILLLMNYINVYNRKQTTVNDTYNKTMYEIVTNVNNMDNLITKLRITTSKEYNINTLSKILTEANTAKNNLTYLPVNQNNMQEVSKFLSQVIGYSEYLINTLSSDKDLSDEEYENLEKINNISSKLNNTLSNVYNKLNEGSLKWNEVEKITEKEFETGNVTIESIASIKDTMNMYEGLIYDGAFSNHLESAEPKNLQGENITHEEAAEKAYECVKNSIKDIEIADVIYNGEINGNVIVYSFNITLKNKDYDVDVEITKNSGKLYLMLKNRKVEKQNIDIKEAKVAGDKYLESLGLNDLEPTYYLIEDNIATINYAGTQDGVLLYPDLIKVKIAMDNKEVLSVECLGYIYNHFKRENITPKITKEEAKNCIKDNVEVKYSTLAIIPKVGGSEVLTYEFKGKANGKNFLIYINAETGKEENVLLIIDNKNGILTI